MTHILAVANLCAAAKANLNSPEKAELIEGLPFSPSTFSKLAKIGNDRRLHDAAILPSLRPHYSWLYELAHLKDDQLEKTLAKTKIVRRQELIRKRAWLKAHPAVPLLPDCSAPGATPSISPAIDVTTTYAAVASDNVSVAAAYRQGYVDGIQAAVRDTPPEFRQALEQIYRDELSESRLYSTRR